MQRGFSPILILVGILIIVAVTGGAFYFGRQTTKPQFISNPEVSPSPAETANWKTYTSSFGYSFKYPSELNLTSGSSVTSYAYDAQLAGDNYNLAFCKPNYCEISKIDQILSPNFIKETVKKTDGLTVSGKPAFRIEGEYKFSNAPNIYHIVEVINFKDNQFINIEANGLKGISPAQLTETLDKILSTFKFANRSVVNIFLKGDVSKEDVDALVTKLQAIKGVKQVKFISEDEALKIYKEAHKDDPALLALAQPKILPASIEVYLDDPTVKNQVEQIAKSKPFVTEVTQSL